jgi:hypothetical protein
MEVDMENLDLEKERKEAVREEFVFYEEEPDAIANMSKVLKGFDITDVIQKESFPAGSNVFQHDFSNMGWKIGKNFMIMYSHFASTNDPSYLIFVNTRTGERISLFFDTEKFPDQG